MTEAYNMIQRKTISKDQALPKIKHYCSYQERCHREVKEKLYSMGLFKRDVDVLISELIEQDYLNEERYAKQYAGGKFRMKKWGRVKIAYELRQNQVSRYCIDKALKEIDEEEYSKVLTKLIEEKAKTLKPEKNHYVLKQKLMTYLLQKGFERDLILANLSHYENKV